MESDDIILEDRYLNIFTDLHLGNYSFVSEVESYQDRFFLRFAPQTVTGIDDAEDVTMLANINQGYLQVQTSEDFDGEIRLTDMAGRTVWSNTNQHLTKGVITQFDVSGLTRGVYLVSLADGQKVLSVKVMK